MSFSPSRAFGRALMAAAKTNVAGAPSATTKASATTATKPPGRPTGITAPKRVSPALAEFLGTSQASRAEAVKKIWDYVKSKGLQNPQNKREIFCDEKLKAVFGQDKVGFAEVAKLLGGHFLSR